MKKYMYLYIKMLEYINLLLIIIIIAVLVVDNIYISRMRDDVSKLQALKLDDKSFLDMSEFKTLNPEFKQNYRKYVVNNLMPSVMEKVNKAIETEKINEYIANNEYEINRQIQNALSAM